MAVARLHPRPLQTVATRFPTRKRCAGLVSGAAATLGIIATCAANYSGATMEARQAAGPGGARELAASSHRPKPPLRLADAGDGWPKSFFDSLFGGGRSSEPRPSRRPVENWDGQQRRHRSYRPTPSRQSVPGRYDQRPGSRFDGGATYRTMCVRLCDGYYWPIGFASQPSNFDRDSKICEQSCDSPAVLYHYRNPGGEPEEMVDLKGQPYISLSSAFLHRTTYSESCKCRPHPWEKEALERHERYAHQPQSRADPVSRRR
jgi:Protein of unknown function (DUF2865)